MVVTDLLLNIQGLKTYFHSDKGIIKAVDDVSLTVAEGESVGLVGESGCGKTVTALSLLGLIPSPPGRIVAGRLAYKNLELRTLRPRSLRKVRGREIAMIFQEPMTALNPVFTIGDQIIESLRLHLRLSRKQAWARANELLAVVKIPQPHEVLKRYPHELSGGMRQRAMIAMALAGDPSLLIADEPTTALDVTIQAQILELLQSLMTTRKLAMILITHDLAVVNEVTSRMMVMYAGKLVETGPTAELMKQPLHPYTKGLILSIPDIFDPAKHGRQKLPAIKGTVPDLLTLPPGCAFADRCEFVHERCRNDGLALTKVTEQREVRCVLYDKGGS